MVRVDEFDYELPEELIAQTPLPNRDDSRLMVVDPVTESIVHSHFRHLLDFLQPGDVLVFNNSKVLPARLFGTKADTGGRVELLLTRALSDKEWLSLAKPAKRLKEGTRIEFHVHGPNDRHEADAQAAPSIGSAVVTKVLDEGLRVIRFDVEGPMVEFLEKAGTVPLPPYIQVPLQDTSRYQTVYAEAAGSVAAPTAGLHFTKELLSRLQDAGIETHYVTLHVGLGTFRPVQVDTVEAHKMHEEQYEIQPEVAEALNRAKSEGRRIIAVGTTSMRTLESAAVSGQVKPGRAETDIFIYPGYQFRFVDALITNFHLPKSTLLMLVAAMMGIEFTRRAYREAVQERYRFFSFGDAMFITRRGAVESAGSL
jgi:S-adenosylmethionine:tRNA ribosyltransferase-isomerase